MFYKIVELANAKKTGHVYLLVHFWYNGGAYRRGEPPILINDFLMQLRPTATHLVTDSGGRVRTQSGEWVRVGARVVEDPEDPWEREVVDRPLVAEIKANIAAYWRRAQARGDVGNHSLPAFAAIERDDKDPNKVLKPDVKALVGIGIEETRVEHP